MVQWALAKKKDKGSEALRELEKLLIEDAHESRSPRVRRRRAWQAIGIRLAVYLALLGLCYALGIFASLRLVSLAFLFFVLLEAFFYYGLDQWLRRLWRRRRSGKRGV
jgi:hypothetical protein